MASTDRREAAELTARRTQPGVQRDGARRLGGADGATLRRFPVSGEDDRTPL